MNRTQLKKLGIRFNNDSPPFCSFDYNNYAIHIYLQENTLKRCKNNIEVIEAIVLQARNQFLRYGKQERQNEINKLFDEILKPRL